MKPLLSTERMREQMPIKTGFYKVFTNEFPDLRHIKLKLWCNLLYNASRLRLLTGINQALMRW